MGGSGEKDFRDGEGPQEKQQWRYTCNLKPPDAFNASFCPNSVSVGTLFSRLKGREVTCLRFHSYKLAFEERPLNPICLIASTLFHLGRKFLTETSVFAKRTSVEGFSRGELKGWQLCMPGWGAGQNLCQSRTRCMAPT